MFSCSFTASIAGDAHSFFLSLVWLLVASGAAAQSWHDDSRYFRLGPRSGYYIMRPGSHLSRQLGLEGAPISDTADPFRHGYGADALAFQFDRAGRLLRALHTWHRRN